MSVRLLLFLLLIFLIGCKSSYINEGKVIPDKEYKHYYVLSDQGTDQDVQEKVKTVTNKIKNAFANKKPVTKDESTSPKKITSEPVKTKQPITIPKRRVRDLQSITTLPQEVKLMPMTEEQVEVVNLKNNVVTYISYLQAIIIIVLLVIILIIFKIKKKHNKVKETTSTTVLNHDK